MNEWLSGNFDPSAGERVRAGVMRRIQRRRWAKRGAVAAVLLLLLAWPRMPEAETLALSMPAVPIAPVVSLAPKRTVFVAKPLLARAAEKIVLFTNDPDVVIVLVSEGGGSE